jgi:hypothetical protein
MVGWRVFNHRVAPVARVFGSDLAGYGLPAIALPVKTPTRGSRTSGPRLVALDAAVGANPPLTDTTARPRAPHPRHRARDLRSSTLA